MPKRSRDEDASLLVLQSRDRRCAKPAFTGPNAESLAASLGYRPELQGLCLPEAVVVLPPGTSGALPLAGSSRAFRVKWASRSHVHDSASDAAVVSLQHPALLRAILAEQCYMFQRHYALDRFPAGGVVVVEEAAAATKVSRQDSDADARGTQKGKARAAEGASALPDVGAALGLWADAYDDGEEVVYDEDCADESDAGGAVAAAGAILECFAYGSAAPGAPHAPLAPAAVRAWVEGAPFRLRAPDDESEKAGEGGGDGSDSDYDASESGAEAGGKAGAKARDVKGAVSRWRTLAERGGRLVAAARAAVAAGGAGAAPDASGEADADEASASAAAGGRGGQALTWNEAVTRGVPERIISHRIRCVPMPRLQHLWAAWRDGGWLRGGPADAASSRAAATPAAAAAGAAAAVDGDGDGGLAALCAEAGIVIAPAPDEDGGKGEPELLAQVSAGAGQGARAALCRRVADAARPPAVSSAGR